jgi:hypothetical protein
LTIHLLIYGAVTFLVDILFLFAMPDFPAKAWFSNAEEKKRATIRLAPNQTDIEPREVHRKRVNLVFNTDRTPEVSARADIGGFSEFRVLHNLAVSPWL